MKIYNKLTAFILLLSLFITPLISHSSDLNISNKTSRQLTFITNKTNIIIPKYSITQIPESVLHSVCEQNPDHCQFSVYDQSDSQVFTTTINITSGKIQFYKIDPQLELAWMPFVIWVEAY